MVYETKNFRINKYDNLRGLAILLVVFGHMIYIDNPYSNVIRNMVFLIHLPLLFFISGYFSKIGDKQVEKSFERILLPYFVFCFIDALINFFLFHTMPEKIFIYPAFGLWFLLSLFLMKISLPLLDKFKYPILMSIVLFLLFGFINIDTNLLALTRTFKYLPFFLLGYYYKTKYQSKENKIEILNSKWFLLTSSIILVIILIFLASHMKFEIFSFATPYNSYDLNSLIELTDRLILTITGIIAVLFLNRVMPNHKGFLTKVGKNSMAVYILHLYFYDLSRKLYINIPSKKVILIVAILLTIILTFILSRDVVTNVYNKFIDFIGNSFKKIFLK